MAAVIQLPQSSFWAKRKKTAPMHQPNDASRSHEYLMADEVERMITAARRSDGRLAERDALSIMMVQRHGLRASELRAIGRNPIITIKGESYRLKDKRKAGLLPKPAKAKE
jgi:integrase